jgi:membrane protein DedA with SNARE-associated domain
MESFLISHAIYAVVVLGVLQAMCVPISSELTFLLGGAVASGAIANAHQHPSLAAVIILGTLAELVGSYISYGIGRAGGRPLVHKLGKYVLVTEADVARAERFLVGRGVWALPVARMLPFVRRFGILSFIGTAIYVTALSSIGYSLGGQWAKVNHSLTQATYVLVVVVVVAIIAFVVLRVREFRREAAANAARGGAPTDRVRR